MSNVMVLAIIVVLVAVVVGVLASLPRIIKKGLPIEKILDTADSAINKSTKILDVAKEIAPANPVINVLSIIDKWAKIAVGNAEQLYHTGDISKDERATVAENVVLNVLDQLKISVDNNKKALIDAAIKEAVNALGHTEPDAKAQQESQNQLQEQNTTLKQENEQLKQTITNIQNTVQAVTPTAV